MKTIALLIALVAQDTDAIKKEVARLASPKERLAAKAALRNLCLRDAKNADALRGMIDAEKDGPTRARMAHVLVGVTLSKMWEAAVPGEGMPSDIAAGGDWVGVAGLEPARDESVGFNSRSVVRFAKARTGEFAHAERLGGYADGPPLMQGGVLFQLVTPFGGKSSHVARLAPGGKPQIGLSGEDVDSIHAGGFLAVDDQRFLARPARHQLAMLDGATGGVVWKVSGVHHTAGGGSGKVVYVDKYQKLTCVEAARQKRLWQTEAWTAHGALGVAGDRVIALGDPAGGDLRAFSLKDGSPDWAVKTPEPLNDIQEWLVSDRHVVVRMRGAVYAYEAATGKLLWSRKWTRLLHTLSGMRLAGDKVAILDGERGFDLVDLASGLSCIDPDAPLTGVSSVAVDRDRLYVLSGRSLSRYEIIK